jgi:hypothetical protein
VARSYQTIDDKEEDRRRQKETDIFFFLKKKNKVKGGERFRENHIGFID